jgi:UDP-N-acetylmuramate dehydrogenase
VPLAPRTTLELGGRAEHFLCARDEGQVATGLAWATARGMPVTILGGGSNVVVADAGVPGLTIAMATRGVRFEPVGERVRVTAAAGESWDALVAACVERGLQGLECLSGIPGLCGAVPVQNVGAYGQEVAQTLVGVRVLERASGELQQLGAEQCGFGYRDSAFKRSPDRAVVLEVSFELKPGGAPQLTYAELREALAGATPTLAELRARVIELRRKKSMVIDRSDENRRSAGSFFMNPVVEASVAERIVQEALASGRIARAEELPQYPADSGRVKLAAGWLIERAGFAKGLRDGHVGISSRHALGLVHHGGGTSAELLALAERVRRGVRERFGVTLEREPVLLGRFPETAA